MSEFNKSYRIRTNVGSNETSVHVKLDRDYDILEIMSLKIDQVNEYKLHTSEYGVIAGRVLANDAFGIPNAKISVFISADSVNNDDIIKNVLYPYNTTSSKNKNNVRYNLLPDERLTDCHTIIGTFPEKQYTLDNNDILEVFDTYYKYTTRTNNAGDYMIFGVPVGSQTVHVDIDLSDIGILSQKPRDMVYKGYNIEQFENPNKFKHSTNLENLTQVISQDNIADVIPFWGDKNEGTIGITRCDINIQYKFEPTCIFMGSVVSDTASNGISKKCIPTPGMGAMDEITTGSGTIEMIRKTPSGVVEEYQVKGTQLINGDGVWCYQIPMNLDYMMTDEFGNMVPTNDPDKGIPTRTRVRFRISMQDFDSDSVNMFRCKMLVPHNPDIYSDNCEADYNYGSATKEDSYRDLFWNCVYSVKSYIPRIQKGTNWKNEKFTGFKRVNYYNDKNPIPYNNIRIRLPFMYRILCTLVKFFIMLASFANRFMFALALVFSRKAENSEDGDGDISGGLISLSGELCDDTLDYMCFIPGIKLSNINDGTNNRHDARRGMVATTIISFYEKVSGIKTGWLSGDNNFDDKDSIDYKNKNENSEFSHGEGNYNGENLATDIHIKGINVLDEVDKLVECIEMNLAEEYKVIQFDFYNDWINGLIYIPRWMRNIRKKRTFFKWSIGGKVKACNENFSKNKRNIVQQCGLKYRLGNVETNSVSRTPIGCSDKGNICHKSSEVRLNAPIFNTDNSGGVVVSKKTNKEQYVYYFKPYENNDSKNIRLFSTDIILLGCLNDNEWGIPNVINEMTSSTYQMPPNMALTDSEIEGSYYRGQHPDPDYPNANTVTYSFKEYDKVKNRCENISGGFGKFINGSEIGNYTEISGINWNYNGPLQDEDKNKDTNDLYKPGGHFLGLTCRNSETTIKTCINLSRICEYGVWMSQRQELNVIKKNGNEYISETVSTTPSGIISGDELSGNNFRRLFATMNSKKLIAEKNDNGYFNYNFININPTNFGGELVWQIKNSTNLNDNLNRIINDNVTEFIVESTDDDFSKFEVSETTVNDKIIMRTNEYFDKEYYKFRFGLNDNNVQENNEKKKRFLLYEKASTGVEHVSFPMYNNSFYFYFGLYDGRTALDEFKKNYYAVCEKNETLVQNNSDKTFECSNWKIIYDGLCDNNPVGEINFDINVSDGLLEKNLLQVTLFDEDGNKVKEPIKITESYTKITFNKLKSGNYTINIKTDDDKINESYYKEIKKIKITSPDITVVDFIEDVSNLNPEEKYKLESGFLCIKGTFTCEDENGLIEYNIGQEHGFMIESKTYGDTIQNFTHWNTGDAYMSIWEGDYINDYVNEVNNDNDPYNDYDVTSNLTKNTNGYLMIPVPYENEEYSVKIIISFNKDCKIAKNKDEHVEKNDYEINLGNVKVGNGKNFEIIYNNIPYSILGKYVYQNTNNTSTNDGWWNPVYTEDTDWTKEDKLTQWKIKENLYQNSLEVPHKVKIDVTGGMLPYEYFVYGMKENYQTTGLVPSDYENVTLPTINYWVNNKRRDNFALQIFDVNNFKTPDKRFYFPVIYKPFFMEMSIWCFDSQNKYFLYGNIYNGRTWDYKNEGFNEFSLNGVSQGKINISKNDNVFEIDEPALGVENVMNNGSGYGFRGVAKMNGNNISIDFKYNGRKVTVSKEVTSYDINKGNPLQINIGCKHVHNYITYSDITSISKTDANLYYSFEMLKTTYGNKTYVKMKAKNNINNATPYKNYIVFDSDTDGYSYPLVNGELKISDKLFRDLIDDKIQNNIQTVTVNGEGGYIDISKYKSMNNGRVYYISTPDNSNDLITETSNPESRLKTVSVSQIIDLNQV